MVTYSNREARYFIDHIFVYDKEAQIKVGNIFDSEAVALVNPVNTDGVMGKGLAYQFKKLYPQNFKDYKNLCNQNRFDAV